MRTSCNVSTAACSGLWALHRRSVLSRSFPAINIARCILSTVTPLQRLACILSLSEGLAGWESYMLRALAMASHGLSVVWLLVHSMEILKFFHDHAHIWFLYTACIPLCHIQIFVHTLPNGGHGVHETVTGRAKCIHPGINGFCSFVSCRCWNVGLWSSYA